MTVPLTPKASIDRSECRRVFCFHDATNACLEAIESFDLLFVSEYNKGIVIDLQILAINGLVRGKSAGSPPTLSRSTGR